MMAPDAMHCFYELAGRQNYSDAAHALGIRPKTLSDTVNALELQIGVTLLSTSQGLRTMRLTHAGETLKALLPRFFAEQEQLYKQVQATGEPLLRVALSGGGSLFEMEARNRLLSQSAPTFKLLPVPLVRQRAGIKQGEFDAGLSKMSNSDQDMGLVVEAAWREPLMVMLPQNHLLCVHEKLVPEMLTDYSIFIVGKCGDDYGYQIDSLLHAHGITNPSQVQEEALVGEVVLAALNGHGIGLLGATQWSHSRPMTTHMTVRPLVDKQTNEPLWLTTYLRWPAIPCSALTEAILQLAAKLSNDDDVDLIQPHPNPTQGTQ